MRIIKVTCCYECPKFRHVGYTPSCGDRLTFDRPVKISEIPDWCPLDTPQTAGFVEANAHQAATPIVQ